MTHQESPQPTATLIEHDHKRIDKLVLEIEKLVAILETQRLVDPMLLVPLKRELRDLEKDR